MQQEQPLREPQVNPLTPELSEQQLEAQLNKAQEKLEDLKPEQEELDPKIAPSKNREKTPWETNPNTLTLQVRDPKKGLSPDNLVITSGGKMIPFIKAATINIDTEKSYVTATFEAFVNVDLGGTNGEELN